jgi:hypothetical protein
MDSNVLRDCSSRRWDVVENMEGSREAVILIRGVSHGQGSRSRMVAFEVTKGSQSSRMSTVLDGMSVYLLRESRSWFIKDLGAAYEVGDVCRLQACDARTRRRNGMVSGEEEFTNLDKTTDTMSSFRKVESGCRVAELKSCGRR